MGSPTEAEEVVAGEEALLQSPEAVETREESRTKFEGLDPEQAQKVAGEAFPGLVNEAAGGPPRLPAGQSIAGFLGNNAAQVNLSEGKHEVIESVGPMAIETSAGHWTPVDLSLNDVGGAFEPKTATVQVRIPTRLGEGVRLSNAGVSLTPVSAKGAALAGSEGALDGKTVFYANTQTDTDTVAKPATGGFEIDTLLRSVDSPEVLYFKVGMPAGASLVSNTALGSANVVLDGQTIAGIAPPTAKDAAGTSVPVQMKVSGNTLVATVEHGSGEYQYPIAVDPHAYDETILLPSNCSNHESGQNTNWEFYYAGGGFECNHDVNGVEMNWVGAVNEGSFDELRYPAHGKSSVTFIEAKTSLAEDLGVTHLTFVHESTVEHDYQLGGVWEEKREVEEGYGDQLNEGGEGFTAQYHENELRIQQTATSSGNEHEGFWFELFSGSYVGIFQELKPTVNFNTSEATISEADSRQNVLYGNGGWLGEYNGAVAITATDPGLGVSYVKIRGLTAGVNGEHWSFVDWVYQDNLCTGIWCAQTYHTYFTYNKEMADGPNTFELCAKDEAFLEACKDVTVNVDNTPPTDINLKGLAESGAELSAAPHQATVEATDATSGVKSITVLLDGEKIGSPSGSCSAGGCTAGRTVTIDGEDLGAGEHKLEMFATDYAGNESSRKVVTFAIRHATPVRIGPGTVDPTTGQFALTASDVAIGGAGRVSRTYLSRTLEAGTEGPLGPQWTMSLGTGQSLKVLADGNIELRSARAESTIFEKEGKQFIAPKGDENVVLEPVEKEGQTSEYLLTQPTAGRVTRFTLPSKSQIWVPAATEGPAERNTVRYAYRTVEPISGHPITEPIEELGPVPAEVTCGQNPAEVSQADLHARLEELQPGCRALSFTYAEETTATGEAESEWGEYNGRLAKVSFTAYNPSSKTMETIAVGQYLYDKQGRLRAEWDPRIEQSGACGGTCSALKTTYGYDSEGHVTALTPSGQESWAFTYGTISGDASTGRLLKVTRASAEAGLWNGKEPENTEAPKLSGTPVVGTMMGVSAGSWGNEPVAYSYQWEDCNSSGEECSAILGATNANYTVTSSDEGHTLVALVSAINGGGSATYAARSITVAGRPLYSTKFGTAGTGEGQLKGPRDIRQGSNGDLWIAEGCLCGNLPQSRIQVFSESGEYKFAFDSHVGGAGTAEAVWGLTLDSHNNAWVANNGKDTIEEFNGAGEKLQSFGAEGAGAGQINKPDDLAVDESGNVWVVDKGNNRVVEFTEKGTFVATFGFGVSNGEAIFQSCTSGCRAGIAGSGGGQFNQPTGIAIGPNGSVYVTDTGNNRVEEFSDQREYIRQFGMSGSGNGQFANPAQIAVSSTGKVWVLDKGNYRVQEFSELGEYLTQFGSRGEGNEQFYAPNGIALGSSGAIWISEGPERGRTIKKWTIPATSEGEHYGAGPGSTIEYHVPLLGSSAPYQMTSTELAKWGQKKDLPEEATAIFPPDEPQGWPASDYKRASIGYLDAQGREVDAVRPGGGTSTVEYNSLNEVVRTLSPADRAIALKEGCESESSCKSAEVADKLDSENKYNGETQAEEEQEEKEGKHEPGMRLLEKVGPEHKVRLANGTEEETRNHETFSYNEGAPSGERYDLVTKARRWAEAMASGEELAKRETLTSYSGQSGLGWKLRKPTSVTSNPEGLDLVQSTVYDSTTGAVVEATTPGAAKPIAEHGPVGGGRPYAVTSGPDGNVWFTEVETNGGIVGNENVTGSVGDITPQGKVTTYGSVPGLPLSITAGPDGNLWFTNTTETKTLLSLPFYRKLEGCLKDKVKSGLTNEIGVLNTNGEVLHEYELPVGSTPTSITAGPDGNLWFTDYGTSVIGKITTSGVVSEYELPAGSAPTGITAGSDGNLWFTDYGTSMIGMITTLGSVTEYELPSGSKPNGIAAGPDGHLWFTDFGTDKIGKITTSGAVSEYAVSEDSKPDAIAAGPNGELWFTDVAARKVGEITTSGTVTEYAVPSGSEPYGIAAARDEGMWFAEPGRLRIARARTMLQGGHTVYYSAEANSSYPGCGNHPEWAGLICQTQPAGQPADFPSLSTSTISFYNIWDEAQVTEEKFGTGSGAVTRTMNATFDAAGRETTSEETATSSEDAAVPAVADEYSSETGALVKLSEVLEGQAKTITSVYNTLGQLASYTDAAGSTTKYAYDIDGRVEEMSEPKGSQIYAYDPTTGFMTKLLDSAAGMFTATYGVEGAMLTEGYPNGMTAKYAYNTIGQATSLEYEKTTNCSEKCVWFSDAQAFGLEGELAYQDSTLSTESYSYNEAGQLTQTQETPVGKGCTVRLYAYDEEGNRLSQTTREPDSEGQCASEGGTVQEHTYDEANRLIDEGVEYETFGNITKLPANDAGRGEGAHELKSTYYLDGQVATQEQNEKTIGYTYDPAGRKMIADTKSTAGTSTAIAHYAGPGEALTWTCEEASECKGEESGWTRNIPGIDGALDAVQENAGTAVLQLHDLQGNIIATTSLSETATELLSTYDSTEFGVPTTSSPPKYSWLGAEGAQSELGTGVITEAGATYVPQVALTLQTEQTIPPGAAANGVMDIETYCPPELPWADQSGAEGAANALAEQRMLELEAKQGGVDPEYAVLLTTRQAEVVALALRHGPAALEALAKSGIIKGLTAFLAERLAEIGREYLKGAAFHLEICYTAIHESSGVEARCRLWIDVMIPEKGVYWFVAFGVETCWGKSYVRKRKVHWTFPRSQCTAAEYE